MRIAVTAVVAAVVGAIAGLALISWLEVGANRTCRDVIDGGTVNAACVTPTAATWALWLGALAGAAVAIAVVAGVRRRRRRS